MRHCYVELAEMGGPDSVRSSIGYNEYEPNQGIPLSCNVGNEACFAGLAMAAILRARLEDGRASEAVSAYCAASVAKVNRTPPVRSPDEYTQTYARSE